jgi:nitrilase
LEVQSLEEEGMRVPEKIASPPVAAVVQAAPAAFDIARSLEKAADLASAARTRGASFVLFPEAFISAYPRGQSFGCTIGARSDEGREQYRLLWESSIDVPGLHTDALGKIARANNVHLVIGVTERASGTLYCTVLFFGPDGSLLGKHRKLMPTASERLIWGSGDASTMPAIETPLGRTGALICWENYMPLARTTMYAKGVELYCAPTADSRDTWAATVRHIALEGRCFVLTSNQFARRGDYPKGYEGLGSNDAEIVSAGGSAIVNPLGQYLAGPNYESETILCAEIDRGDIVRARLDFDCIGHYARPDIFKLNVDESQHQSVCFRGALESSTERANEANLNVDAIP